ncbi:MAG: HAMP domain-containing protein, partial [Cyanobacteriota bacterium]
MIQNPYESLEHGARVELVRIEGPQVGGPAAEGPELEGPAGAAAARFLPVAQESASSATALIPIQNSGRINARERRRGDGGAGALRRQGGEPLLAAWRELPLSSVSVLATMPEREALRYSRDLQDTLWQLVLITALLMMAVGLLLGRRLARPIQDLHDTVQRFEPEDESSLTLVTIRGDDEIAGLAGTINSMVLRIRERTIDLRHTSERLDTYIQTVQSTLLALDFQGRVQLLNRSGCTLLGIEPETVAGMDWLAWVLPEDREGLRHWLAQAAVG